MILTTYWPACDAIPTCLCRGKPTNSVVRNVYCRRYTLVAGHTPMAAADMTSVQAMCFNEEVNLVDVTATAISVFCVLTQFQFPR